jgi:hypothetical protein
MEYNTKALLASANRRKRSFPEPISGGMEKMVRNNFTGSGKRTPSSGLINKLDDPRVMSRGFIAERIRPLLLGRYECRKPSACASVEKAPAPVGKLRRV